MKVQDILDILNNIEDKDREVRVKTGFGLTYEITGMSGCLSAKHVHIEILPDARTDIQYDKESEE